MKANIKLGVVCLGRNTFDYSAAGKIFFETILPSLKTLENVEIIAYEQIIMEKEEAIAASSFLSSKGLDGLIVISGTFHLGHLLLELKKEIERPLLLWGLPELPYDGGKIRLNSVCGVNMNASNLVKSGINDFTYHVGLAIDEDWVDAVRMIAVLKRSHVGVLMSRADGFFNVDVNELALYKKFGVIVDYYQLSEVWDLETEEALVNYYLKKTANYFEVKNLNEKQKYLLASLAAKLKVFMEKHHLNCLAIRCWPEFAKGYGIAPCASMSLLQSEDLILACEGDIDCAITMLCHQAIGARYPFMADLSQVNIEENTALLWHCGVAPCNLAERSKGCVLDLNHAQGRGITAGFVMKSGKVHLARLDSINGVYRLFQETGEAIPMDRLLTGTYAKVVFERPMQAFLDKVIYSGLAHHVSLVYQDCTRIFEIFARLKELIIL